MLGKYFKKSLFSILGLALLATLIRAEVMAESEADLSTAAKQQGQQAALKLMKALKAKLQSTIKQEGLTKAASTCSLEARSIKAQVNSELTKGVLVSRISTKYRNPENIPTQEDQIALSELSRLNNAQRNEGFVLKERDLNFVYYKPLYTSELCLNCHGHPENMSIDINNFLKKHYPEDRATGYRKGELRGAVKVVIPKSQLVQR